MTHASQSQLIRLAAGELPPAEQEDVQRHVDSCADCQRLYREVGEVHDALGDWTIDAPQRDVWPEIERSLGSANTSETGWRRTYRLTRIAAAIVLGTGIGYGAGWMTIARSAPSAQALPKANGDDALAAVGFKAIESSSATGLFGVIASPTEASTQQEVEP